MLYIYSQKKLNKRVIKQIMMKNYSMNIVRDKNNLLIEVATDTSDVKGVLTGLGFSEDAFNLLISELSGGQKTRIALGKLLLQQPDVLILDEPTNHLDITTLTWLENYLTSYPGAIVIVSHDRYFLDKIVN